MCGCLAEFGREVPGTPVLQPEEAVDWKLRRARGGCQCVREIPARVTRYTQRPPFNLLYLSSWNTNRGLSSLSWTIRRFYYIRGYHNGYNRC